jgi:tetratricopeptide (TPR) repeat protein
VELRRLLKVQRAYESMNRGDALLGSGDVEGALKAYTAACAAAPDMDELPFWQAVTLADTGRFEEAVPFFRAVFAANPNWVILLQRLPKVGLIKNDPDLIAKIVDLAK